MSDDASIKEITKTHDTINVVLISILTFSTLWVYITNDVNYDSLIQLENGTEAKPAYLWLTWGAGLYSLYDLIYIIAVPECTKRPGQLIFHHVATIIMVCVALAIDFESMTAKLMLVEVNTLILTVQKLFRLKIPMLITWFFLRVVWYPMLTLESSRHFQHPRFHPALWYLIMACYFVLNGLNFYWSAEFALPKEGQGFMKRKDA